MASGQDISRCWCVDTAYHAVELVKQYVEAHPDKVIGSEQCVCAACLADIAQCSVAQSSAVDIFIP